MSQNVPMPPSSLDGRFAHSLNLTGALALGIGLVAPTTGYATPVPACNPLPYTVSIDSCGLDVNGGGFDITVNVSSTFGLLESSVGNVNLLDMLSSKVLLQLSPGDHVGAAIFAANRADTIGEVYGSVGDFWDQIGETGFAGFRIGTAGSYNYGWVELTRGSIIVDGFGYQTTLNADAVIPSGVPEPGTLLLLATGAAGIAALRRRRTAAAPTAH